MSGDEARPPDGLLVRALRVPTRRPWLTLAALLLAAIAGGAGMVLRGVRTEFGVEQFLPHDDPVYARYDELNAQFGRDDNTVFVFVEREGGWFTPEGLALADRIADALANHFALVDEVVGVTTARLIHDEGDAVYVGPVLTDERLAALDREGAARLGEHLRSEPVYRGRVVSADGRTIAFAVRIADDFYGGRFHGAIVGHVSTATWPFRRSGELTFHITGGPPTQFAYRRFLEDDAAFSVVATCLLLAVALWITLRSAQGVVLPLLAIGLALHFTFVFLSLSGRAVNLLSSAIPVLVLIVGVSDALHLLTRYAEELAGGLPKRDALERAVVVTAHACLLTSITTSAGFFVLPATGIPLLTDMGIVTGAGVILAYLTSLTLIPALAILLPAPTRLPPQARDTALYRLGEWVMGRPKRVVGGLLLVVAALVAVGAPRLRVESRVVDDLPPSHPVVQTRAAVARLMGGNFPLTFLIHPTPAAPDREALLTDPGLIARLAAFQRRLPGLSDPPYVSSSLSTADYLALGWQELGGEGLPDTREGLAQIKLVVGDATLEPTVDAEGRFLRLQLRVYDLGTQATFAFLERARAAFAEVFGDRARLEVQGFTYLAHRTHRGIVESSMTSFTLDFLIVALLVAGLFRSVRLTALAIVPNVFPLVCTVAFMGLAGIDLRISSAIVFSIVFGIAVDDTVHFLARFHEERGRGLSARAAASRTNATTGRAMVFMAFVLASGFGVLLLSAFSPNRVLGLLMAVTVVSGIVGDLVLLPALLVLGSPAEAEA